jgi:hypothetical protein
MEICDITSHKKLKTQPPADKAMLKISGTHKDRFWNTVRRGAQQQTVLMAVRCCGTS